MAISIHPLQVLYYTLISIRKRLLQREREKKKYIYIHINAGIIACPYMSVSVPIKLYKWLQIAYKYYRQPK